MTISSDSFKDRLKHVMGGVSGNSFAKKCEISESAIRNYLKGATTPDLTTLQKIADVSGCSLAWLASGEEPAKAAVSAVDEGLLVSVIEGVEEYLNQVDGHLPPAKKAQLVATLYDMCAEDGIKAVDKAKVIRLVRLAA